MRDASTPTPDELDETATAAPTGEPGTVQVIVGADRTRIVLSGEVDADMGAELSDASAEAESRGLPIEVDAHHVTFMDSSGVAFLARLSIRSSHRVRLLRVPPTVQFLLEVTRIGELVDVVDAETEPFEPLERATEPEPLDSEPGPEPTAS